MSASGLSAAGGQIEPASVQQNAIKVVEKEEMTDENQTADTSEEDLNLTGNCDFSLGSLCFYPQTDKLLFNLFCRTGDYDKCCL